MRRAGPGLLALFFLAAGPRDTPAAEILVFSAASLTEALDEIGRFFHAEAATAVKFSFGASSDLARQIEAGAPADVFFSADTARMDALQKAGLVRGEDRREFLSNELVVVVPVSSSARIVGPEDLAVLPRLALADPEAVPAGIYARRWLEKTGLWERLQPRIIPTLDVRGALAAVESGAASAGIVYRTDAAISRRVRIAWTVPDGPKILYCLAPLTRSKSPAARAFVDFAAGPRGREIFRRHGFVIRP